MDTETRLSGTDARLALAVGVVAALATLGLIGMLVASPVAANHGADQGNYTVVLPNEVDHLPGDQNPEGASMQNFAQAGDRFAVDGAPDGFETLDYLETGSEEIDYSACDSVNTAVFGIDRGNNNSGTQVDTDLLQHMESSNFHENGIEVNFYEESDFGGDPTHLNPEDAIVAVQGDGSSGGPCFTMPTEPGWYQVSGFVEGTTPDGETVRVQSNSHYFPICDGCHDEDHAESELGPPPSQQNGDDDEGAVTPTPGSDDDAGDTDETTPTPDAGDTDDTTGDDDGQQDDGQSDDGQPDGETDDGATGETGSDDGAVGATPTPGDGPGLGALGALAALLAGALLAHRRS